MTAFIEPREQQTAVAAVLSAGEKRSRALVHFIMGRAAVELREYFKKMWRQKYRREWDPTGTDKYSCPWGELSCHDLFRRVEEDNTRNEKRLILDDEKELRRLISSADPSDWDFSLVCKILLHSRLCYHINHRRTPQQSAIKRLRAIRNDEAGHMVTTSLSEEKFIDYMDRAIDALNVLGVGISDEERRRLKAIDDIEAILAARAQSPVGKLQQWLSEFFRSRVPIPTVLVDPVAEFADRGTDESTPKEITLKESLQPSGTLCPQVACIWFTISCLDEFRNPTSVATPGVGTNADLTIGWDKRMRSFINHGELSEVDSGEHVSWLLGLSDEMLSCKHCRIYYKGGEWFVETLGKFLAKVKRYRGDEKLQVKFGHPMNLRNGDQITINKSYRFVCHVHHMPFQHCDPIPRILGQDGDLGEAPKKATGLTELTAGTAGLAIATRSEQHSDV